MSTTQKPCYDTSWWTPITTRLLNEGGSSAWNVIDNVMGRQQIVIDKDDGNVPDGEDFCDSLTQELKDAKVFDRLSPARTAGDAKLDQLLSIATGTSLPTSRGDKSIFLSREYRKRREFAKNHPHLHYLISNISHCVQNAVENDVHDDNAEKSDDDDNGNKFNNTTKNTIKLDLEQTSVQLAVYPGDGISGYARHCDRGQDQCQEELSATSITQNTQQSSSSSTKRIITAIYYLTEKDWHQQKDGGCLRLFSPSSSSGIEQDTTTTTTVDIPPYRDRLIIFRSDGVEHQVMPSLRRDRTAITIWFYGQVFSTSSANEASPPPSSVPSVPSADRNKKPDGVDSSNKDIIPPPPLILQEPSSKTTAATLLDDNEDEDDSTIFVSIASYRDSEIVPTLKSLFSTAYNPNRIFVGLVIQMDDEDKTDIDTWQQLQSTFLSSSSANTTSSQDPSSPSITKTSCIAYKNHIRYLKMPSKDATGPCLARALCQTLHRGEEYILQIDSHMRFRPNWDEYLIQLLLREARACSSSSSSSSRSSATNNEEIDVNEVKGIDKKEQPQQEERTIQQQHRHERQTIDRKIVLTAYPPGYVLPNTILNNETRGTMLLPWKFDEKGVLRQKGRFLTKSDILMNTREDRSDRKNTNGTNQQQQEQHHHQNHFPRAIPCYLYAGGFNFTFAYPAMDDVPYDSTLHHLFFGEELSMAVRYYTHGYTLMVPPETICYHLWSRSYRPTQSVDHGHANTATPTAKNDEDSKKIIQQQQQQQRQRAYDKVYKQLLGDVNKVSTSMRTNTRFGLGTERTPQEFAMKIGVDFENKQIISNPNNQGDDSDDKEDAILRAIELLTTDTTKPSNSVNNDGTTTTTTTTAGEAGNANNLSTKVSNLDSNAKELIAFFLGGGN